MSNYRVRMEVDVPGQGFEAHEFEYCPFVGMLDYPGGHCPFGSGAECLMGLTTIEPPGGCPLRLSPIEAKVSLVRV